MHDDDETKERLILEPGAPRIEVGRQEKEEMKRIIDVNTGEVEAGGRGTILRSNAIASCVVVAAYDPAKKVGALAHVMVPGAAPGGKGFQRTRYAADAIEEMMSRMTELGVNKEDIEVCLVGGGNVLKKEDDTICRANIASVVDILDKKRVKIRAKTLGGTERRTVSLDVDEGSVHYTVGDGKRKLLWKAAEGSDEKEEASRMCGT